MRKIKNKQKYRRYQNRRYHSFIRSVRRSKKAKDVYFVKIPDNVLMKNSKDIATVIAPVDFRFLHNMEECACFFRSLRNKDFHHKVSLVDRKIKIDLSNVEKIDYAVLTVLTAISDQFKENRVVLEGNMPINIDARDKLKKSGFLDHLIFKGIKPNTNGSEHLSLSTSTGKMTKETRIKVVEKLKQVSEYLGVPIEDLYPLKTMIWEICNNAIEWANTKNKQWILAVNYEDNRVVFSFVDIGNGILDTIKKKFRIQVEAFLSDPIKVLMKAFEKKYSSSSTDINRNKGLPCIKNTFEKNIISSLKVITNEVLLNFENSSLSSRADKGSPRFKGTFYSWEVLKRQNGN